MSTGLKVSVRFNLALVILVTILLSWLLSTGIANYLNYQAFRSFRAEMLRHPDTYRPPMPEPRFGLRDFFIGHPPLPNHPGGPPPPPDDGPNHGPGHDDNREPPPPPPDHMEWRWVLLRLGIAFSLAGLAGAWLGRGFTTPLTHLTKAAESFQSGDFGYRIPIQGENEFSTVAAAMNEMAEQVAGHIGQLEKDAERRRQFLADIAHELRSPVTTMRTMAGALQDGLAHEPERQERAVAAMVNTSERLLRLVQDIMDLAKLDLNELPLNVSKHNLVDLIAACVNAHTDEAAAAGLILHPFAGPPAIVAEVDADRITQALNNILENAICYAGPGAEITVSVTDADPIEITIADTGKGIPPEHLPHISDAFYRADSARTPSDFHSGLGLSITRRIVEAHGGQLLVLSQENQGATVTIRIPKLLSRSS